MSEDSDTMPLDGDTPLTPEERKALRRLIRDDERATWVRRQLRIFVPIVVAMVVGAWQVVVWVRDHITFKP